MDRHELKARVGRASKWAFSSELVAKLITPAIFIVLVRLLTPEDFGVVTAAMMIITFAQLLWDAGMGKAVIQREADLAEIASIAFWNNIVLSLLIYAALFIFADPLAGLLGDSRVATVLRVQGLQMPIMAVAAVHRALLQREFAYKKLFWVRLTAAGVPGLFSLPLAWSGYGYWAVVAGSLVGAAGETVVLWCMSSWHPKLIYPKSIAPEVWKFGLLVMGEGLLTWGIAWCDAFIVGRYLGSEALGFYRGGAMLVSIVFTLALSPMLPLLFGALSRLQNDDAQFRQAYLKSSYIFALISLPVGVAFLFLSEEFTEIAFGAQWRPAASVVGTLGLLQGISWMVGGNPEAYRAKGRPGVNVKVNILTLCYYFPILWLSIRSGLESFLIARLGVGMISFVIHHSVAACVLKSGVGVWLKETRWILIAVVMQAAAMHGLHHVIPRDFSVVAKTLLVGGAGILSLSIGLWSDREKIKNLVLRFLR